VSDYIALFHKVKTLFPDIHVIMTVSPIRHWKDGAHENNISKSVLLRGGNHIPLFIVQAIQQVGDIHRSSRNSAPPV
jgi:hypothetical protein